ncbi:sulfide/dihydroorotate dehydrogenase-like FAD/NAD-binding protein [Enterococcus dongliensis]|uniref:Sulfide/dihydroorotate dehydrogenase-like FAD/NAD-binding protein n=1 Tax=Enterococcus dongliensis TaxID=2559925 RepID=A0AAP5U0A6_9ENTE|nr:sulfide/dihydroorotate dehydrogenase-like FAD/NAD-binding protein [Enterococcus dongliensis]MDT2595940.1 sulfide/dihydroorotate dehydrogenase-like FAD/NAD-binding protein [Enterococcus dongliensis]MDT2602799.1 sulfide/dihydroorotate dehydrogenase-like FAD/NAD-binding protein [Enterococcus dongliensis]MDT2634007.1 sulfide/dihydroorotate dehydrogenase-like FAD/NAD-binding protein [Enterococcus dongliensis]MDT2637231.1 sulfide/dihydroorotate dehydrogenase-like FAD/NAD-binding protein [Enterococ
MFKVLERRELAPTEYEILVDAPRIASKAKPGQFVILRIDEYGERIPLTIVDRDKHAGWIRLIFQVIGKSTAQLATVTTGEYLKDVVGPLGKATEIENYGTVLLVGGGVGIAALFPIVKGLKEAGNRVITILGAKNQNLLILQEECAQYSDELILMTDDGSIGKQGLVTDAMEEVFQREKISTVWAIGPSIMMKFCTLTAQKYKVPIYVSLNPIMIDGTGMCGGCRVTVADSIKFACVDGPEFLGEEVNWDEFVNRMQQYRPEELLANKRYEEQVISNG